MTIQDVYLRGGDFAAIWTSTTTIIKFTIMEMDHSDGVNLQYDMHQNITELLRCFKYKHTSKMSNQWAFEK